MKALFLAAALGLSSTMAFAQHTHTDAEKDFKHPGNDHHKHHHEHHAKHEHEHKADCGHKSVVHDDHIDYEHDGHKHHLVDNHVHECDAPKKDEAKKKI